MLPVSVVIPTLSWREKFFVEHCRPAIEREDPAEIIVVPADGRNPATNRNIGARDATQEFLYFLDDDVVIREGSLRKMMDALNRTGAHFAYGNRLVVDRNRREVCRSRCFDAGELRRYNYVSNMSMMRRQAFPGYDESIERLEDWDLWLRIVQAGGEGVYLPSILHESHRIDAGQLASAPLDADLRKVKAKHGVA